MSRKFLQQAIDAMSEFFAVVPDHPHDKALAAITAIREYLAQPEPEPVAWMSLYEVTGRYTMWGQKPTGGYFAEHPEKLIPLYRQPGEMTSTLNWQPIATHPTEGMFFVWGPGDAYPIIARYNQRYEWIEDLKFFDELHLRHLTHWAPLPAPPEAGTPCPG